MVAGAGVHAGLTRPLDQLIQSKGVPEPGNVGDSIRCHSPRRQIPQQKSIPGGYLLPPNAGRCGRSGRVSLPWPG